MASASLLFVTLLSASTPSAQAKPATLAAHLDAFCRREWTSVYTAKERLESREREAIPDLIKLVFRPERVPLVDTADLIYPGAKTFYGHGWLIDYDLDYLAGRAGWLLEEITFEDFGFSSGSIRERPLFDAVSRGSRDVALGDVLPQPKGPRSFQASAERARTWWASNSGTWTRFKAVRAALASTSARRQMNVLGWLRYGKTPCLGLSKQSYASELSPLVQHLAAHGSAEVRQQARLLLDDREGYWLKLKTEDGSR